MPYWPALDGLRGIAILLVVAGHVGLLPELAPAVGVNLFFVLSGFLITTVLMGTEHSLRVFYGARAARLLPALALTVAGTGVIWLAQGRDPGWFAEQAATALLYVENFFRASHNGQVLSHAWSLAVEEQFYLLWPLLLPLVFRLRGWGRLGVLLGVVVGSMLLRVVLAAVGAGDQAYASLPTNAYALLLGCLVAVLPRLDRYRRLLTAVGAAGLAVATFAGSYAPAPGITVPPVAAGASVLLLVGALQGSRVLARRELAFVGRVSYAWYLWHWPLLWLTGNVEGGVEALWLVTVSFALAAASTILLEEPVRSWWRTRRLPTHPDPAGAARATA